MFALSLYESERRTKEIGIRKINGASIQDILNLLSRDFLRWIFLAFLLASPVAYFIMRKWLEGFVYNTVISWWIFALAGISAIFITLITISYQTYKAARRNPVETLRYEENISYLVNVNPATSYDKGYISLKRSGAGLTGLQNLQN